MEPGVIAPQQFVKDLATEVRAGFSVIPLVGSGISSPSGILTGEAFGDYLLACVWDALRDPKPTRLDLGNGIWPRSYSPEEIADARCWITQVASNLASTYANDRDASTRPLATLHQEAIGALADWRSTLFFLSRLGSRTNQPLCYDDLGPPDPRIVDSFNYHLTRGHTHTLGHQMLSFLTRLLRIRTILTTNFDTLLEQAFAAARIPLDVFDVHLTGGLPDPRLVRSQLSLIKLHGSRFETRADLSLDSSPTDRDLDAFLNYFQTSDALPTHLLVLGFSGRDKRVLALMKTLVDADHSDDSSKVFWVCHQEGDVTRAIGFRGQLKRPDRVIVTRARADLLLFELYQRFVSTLPPAGSTYEFAQYTPPAAALFYRHEDAAPLDRLLNAINGTTDSYRGPTMRIERCSRPENHDSPGRTLLLCGTSGVSSLAELAFARVLASRRHALWFELDDFCGRDDLAVCILQCVAAQQGQFDLNVVTLSPRELGPPAVRQHFHIQPRDWVLFLYGRQSAGTSAGWNNRPWPDKEFSRLWDLFHDLEEIGFTVVYMPLSGDRKADIEVSVREALGVTKTTRLSAAVRELLSSFIVDPLLLKPDRRVIPNRADSLLKRPIATVLGSVAKWIRSGGLGSAAVEERRLFLYVTTLFRQSRHLSALCSEAAYPDPYRFNTDGIDNDLLRMEKIERWAGELLDLGLLRRKDGGFLWMHRDLREILRILLEDHRYKWVSKGESLLPKRSRSHHWLAEWYLRAHRATGNATPFVESFYHRLQCIQHLQDAEVPGHLRAEYARQAGTAEEARQIYRRVECEINLREAAKLLNSGKRVPVLDLEEAQREALFAHLPKDVEHIASRYHCIELWREVVRIAERLRTFASLQSRDPESVSGSFVTHVVHDWDSRSTRKEARVGSLSRRLTRQEDRMQHWENAYTHIKARVPFDQFSITRGELIELLKDLGFQIDAHPTPASIRRAMVDSIAHQRPSAQWRFIIKALRRLAHLFLKETAIRYHLHEVAAWPAWLEQGSVSGTEDAKQYAAIASSLLTSAEQCGWLLDASSRDSQTIESVACHSLHGLALAYLDRFTEAQRKIDEATGALSASSLSRDPLELAILELRRGALFMLEARFVRANNGAAVVLPLEPTDAARAAGARVEDAWRCLERAHSFLAGNSRMVSWWERLYTMRLRALALNQELHCIDEKYNVLMGYPDAVSEEATIVAYRSARLLRPSRTRVITRASHYFVLAHDPSTRADAARESLKDLNEEEARLEGTRRHDRPDAVVIKYFRSVKILLGSMCDHSVPE